MQFDAEVAPERPARSIATLEDYLEAMSKRKLVVIACILAGILGAFAVTKDRVAFYEASAKVLLNAAPAGTTDGRLVDPNLEREASVIAGEDVEQAARAKLDLPAGAETGDTITVTYTPQSDSLTVKVGSNSAARAAALTNALIDVYTTDRVGDQAAFYETNLSEFADQIAEQRTAVDSLKKDIEAVDQQSQLLRSQPYSVDRDLQISLLVTQRTNTMQSIGIRESTILTLQQQAAVLQRNRDGGKVAAIRLTTASVPDTPTGVPTWAYYAAGGLGGLLLGVALAFLRHRLDRRAQSTREVEFALGTRVIGAIPPFNWRFRRGTWALLMGHDKGGAALGSAREAYRRLRSSVSFLARTTESNVVVFTSSKPLEGKSTTSANLAVTIARGGSTVALVSADLRRPSLERLFGIAPRRGLTDFLTGATETVQTEILPDIPNLVLIPAGAPLDNPGELFGGDRFRRLVQKLRSEFDLVIIDTPPLKVAADAAAAAHHSNGVIVVVDGNRTESPELVAIRRELDRAGVELLGAVMNRDRSQRVGRLGRGRYGYYVDKRNRRAPSIADEFADDLPAGGLVLDDEVERSPIEESEVRASRSGSPSHGTSSSRPSGRVR